MTHPDIPRGILVVGVDVALRQSGVAAIKDRRLAWRSTIKVEGDKQDTGPRYAILRRSLEALFGRMRLRSPALIVIEQPEHGIRAGHEPESVMKLYGAFAVCYAECCRLYPRATVRGVTPREWKGNLQKDLTARMMASKYDTEFNNYDEADAVGLADYAWDLAVLERKKLTQK